MIERQEPHSKPEVNSIAPGRLAVHFPHVAPDIIESIQMYDLIEKSYIYIMFTVIVDIYCSM